MKSHRRDPFQLCFAMRMVLAVWLCFASRSARSEVVVTTPPAPPNPAAPKTIPESERIRFALDPALPLEQKRYLLYLYARVNKPAIAEKLSAEILKRSPGDKQTLLVLASMYIEQRNPAKALVVAREFLKLYPRDNQGLYFLGAAHYQMHQYAEANQILRDLKLTQFNGKLYPYQTDLASSALQAGDWYKSMLAYQELLRHHQLSDELRLQARDVLERIYHENLPQAALETTTVFLKPGMIYRADISFQSHLSDTHLLKVTLGRYQTEIDATNDVEHVSATHWEGVSSIKSLWNKKWITELKFGGSEEGLLGGIALQRSFGDQRSVGLSLNGGARSTDGLFMESLNARENKIAFNAQWLFTPDWFAQGEINGRELLINNRKLGLATGGNFQLERILWHENPDIRVGYRAVWMNYSPSMNDTRPVEHFLTPAALPGRAKSILDGLLPSNIHREGLYIQYRDQLSGVLFWRVSGGADYALDRNSFEEYGRAGISFFPRKSIEIRADGAYTTSAGTGDLNYEQWQMDVALRWWF